jgi:uncharacterized protein (DUF983 family)
MSIPRPPKRFNPLHTTPHYSNHKQRDEDRRALLAQLRTLTERGKRRGVAVQKGICPSPAFPLLEAKVVLMHDVNRGQMVPSPRTITENSLTVPFWPFLQAQRCATLEGEGGAPNVKQKRNVEMGRLLLFVGRAIQLRCPWCGEGKLFSSWITMRETCAACSFVFEREEGYFTGAIGINLVVAELLFVACFIGSVILTWPNVPWNWMYGWGIIAVLAPILFYPFSKALWLAADLTIRPPEPYEFESIDIVSPS